jgi:ribosomal protein S18 acetylase RimI-like enzyme
MQNTSITLCEQQDAETLALLGRTTFHDTFAAQNMPEDMAQYLDATFNTAHISQELQDPNVWYYLATAAKEPVGCLKLNFSEAQTEFQDDQALELERIRIMKAYSGAGIGELLMDKAIVVAKEAGLKYVWQGVWERNPRVIRFDENQIADK